MKSSSLLRFEFVPWFDLIWEKSPDETPKTLESYVVLTVVEASIFPKVPSTKPNKLLFKMKNAEDLKKKILFYFKNRKNCQKKIKHAKKRLKRFDYNENMKKFLNLVNSIWFE